MPEKKTKTAKRPRAAQHRQDGAATRAHIVKTALKLFRKQGFDGATMRSIAATAEVSLGLAYHYFPSKDAIILDYYRELQANYAAKVRAELPKHSSLQGRIGMALEIRLGEIKQNRELFTALSRVVLDPTNSSAVFSPEGADLRRDAIALMREVMDHADVPEDTREVAATALWTLMLALIISFLFEDKKSSGRTDGIVALATQAIPLLLQTINTPAALPMRLLLNGALSSLGLLTKASN